MTALFSRLKPSQIKISVKLPMLVVLLALIAATTTAAVSYLTMQASTYKRGTEVLSRDAHAAEQGLELWLKSLDSDLVFISDSPAVSAAIQGISGTWEALGTDAGSHLQKAYVDNNPYPAGERHKLNAADNGTDYDRKHAEFHPHFLRIAEIKGLSDLLLFDAEGNLIYSVRKRPDFATNVVSGEWSSSHLAGAFNSAIAAGAGSETVFVDYAPFAPSNDAPVSFIARPVVGPSGDVIGVIAFELAGAPINAVLKGLGRAHDGERIYAVGPDLKMRGDLDATEPGDGLHGEPDNPAVKAALRGDTGITEFRRSDGTLVVAAYEALTFHGTNWAIVSEENINTAAQ